MVSGGAWREALALSIEIHKTVEESPQWYAISSCSRRWGAWQPIGLATAAISVCFQ
jgi:hypothetical protein